MIKYTAKDIPQINKLVIDKPLPESTAESVLFNLGCHVDHEGFDLNEIEQHYYKHNGIALHHDKTWYKDGGQEKGTNGVLHDWIGEIQPKDQLIVDHSHFVFKYPITGEAANQIKYYSQQRPELLRILSSGFKCGLDLCIDYINSDRVEPIVHIEWDFDSITDLLTNKTYVEDQLKNIDWQQTINIVLRYNKLARINKITAFEQADFRSMLVFGKKSYYLIPTL
jgi:hypothetical protein